MGLMLNRGKAAESLAGETLRYLLPRGKRVAVGTTIADRPPRGSVRTALPHTALRGEKVSEQVVTVKVPSRSLFLLTLRGMLSIWLQRTSFFLSKRTRCSNEPAPRLVVATVTGYRIFRGSSDLLESGTTSGVPRFSVSQQKRVTLQWGLRSAT